VSSDPYLQFWWLKATTWTTNMCLSCRKERNGHRFARLVDKLKGTNRRCSQFQCVFMPRREYLKHFARDDNGIYIGTESERRWSKEELDTTFGAYCIRQPRKWVLRNEGDQAFLEENNVDV